MERTRAVPKEVWRCRNMGNDGIAKVSAFILYYYLPMELCSL
jgi:hypothetical protein